MLYVHVHAFRSQRQSLFAVPMRLGPCVHVRAFLSLHLGHSAVVAFHTLFFGDKGLGRVARAPLHIT